MTPKQYRKRFEALGYNISSWARHCGVSRTTITHQCSGKWEIKRLYWIALDAQDGLGIE